MFVFRSKSIQSGDRRGLQEGDFWEQILRVLCKRQAIQGGLIDENIALILVVERKQVILGQYFSLLDEDEGWWMLTPFMLPDSIVL